MKVFILEFDEGIACVLHSTPQQAISFLTATYGALPSLTEKYSIVVGDMPPRIMAIRGSVVLSQHTIVKQRTQDLASDVYDFKGKVPSIDQSDGDFGVTEPEEPNDNFPAFN